MLESAVKDRHETVSTPNLWGFSMKANVLSWNWMWLMVAGVCSAVIVVLMGRRLLQGKTPSGKLRTQRNQPFT